MKSGLRVHLLLIAGAVSIVYLNSFRGLFQFDDYNVIVHNEAVHSLSAWLQDLPHGIRPLLKFTYMLNWGSSQGTFSFHSMNLAVHLVNALLVYLLILKVLNRDPEIKAVTGPALITALLFAVHPIQTEAITYICGRSTSLMTMFYFASILAYIKGVSEKRGLFIFLYSPVLFLLAVCVKETAVTLPIALLLWEGTGVQRRGLRKVCAAQSVHWAMLCAILIAVIAHPGHSQLLEYSFDVRSMKDNILSQINAIPYLMSKLILVNRLNIDPDLPILSHWSIPLALRTAFLASLAIGGAFSLKRFPWFGFGLLWFFLHLLPTNSVVPRTDVANDRQLYLPSLGLFLAVATVMDRVRRQASGKGVPAKSGIVILLMVLGWFTVARNSLYGSEVALWEDARLKSPGKARVYNNLGCAYYLAGRYKEAGKALEEAVRLNPDYTLARANLRRLLDFKLEAKEGP